LTSRSDRRPPAPDVLVTLALLLLTAQAAASPPPSRVSLDQYVAALDRLVARAGTATGPSAADPLALLKDVPAEWIVQTPERTWTIPTRGLRADLTAWQRERSDEARRQFVERLQLMRSHAAAAIRPAPEIVPARDHLTNILAEREFRGIHGPTWFDRLRERALLWMLGLLGRLVGASSFPTIANLLVYVVIGLAVLLTAWWMHDLLRRSARDEAIAIALRSMPDRTWQAWLAAARDAAARGDGREAIHLAQWCAIAWLEQRGAWRPDQSRTPREYARLLGGADAAAAPLRGLVSLTERVWYGTLPADAARVDEALARLRDIGCPLS